MFQDTLLDSSPRQVPVLCRTHYLLAACVSTLVFAQGWHQLPSLLGPVDARTLFAAAAMAGIIAALDVLMLCYVWVDTRREHLSKPLWFAAAALFNLPGFLVYLVYSARRTGDWKRAAIPLAYITNSLMVAALVLVPIIYTQALPNQLLVTTIHVPPPPGPPPAPPTGQPVATLHRNPLNVLTAPVRIPPTVAQISEAPEPPRFDAGVGVVGAVPNGAPGGVINGVIGSAWGAAEPPPPPPRPHAATSAPATVRLGGDVIAARALDQPPPLYPPLAMMAHIQGTVVLEAIIATDGTIKNLKVRSGHPLLVRAALDAVKTWRYQPTLLNTQPVEVLTEIDVNFRLGE